MGLFSNFGKNLSETRQIQRGNEETNLSYQKHFQRYEADLMLKMNTWIKKEMGLALSNIEKEHFEVHKKHNNIVKELTKLYQEMGESGFEEGCLKPWDDERRKMWDGRTRVKIFVEDSGISTKAVVDEYVSGAVRVYLHCHEYGYDRQLPQNFELRRR